MKSKNLLITIISLGVILLSFSIGMAKVSGPCVDCHTMHYSQDGATPLPSYHGGTPVGDSGPYGALLVNGCVGCHSGSVTLGGTDSEIPVVFRLVDPVSTGVGNSLAGGDFYWVNAGNATKGHDVIDLPGITGPDTLLGLTPPGWNATATPGLLADGQIHGGASSWTSQLKCGGTYGCHGRHDEATNAGSVRGAHHGDDSSLKPGADFLQSAQGADITTSYRWLGGIEGIEDPDWEDTATASDHNQYKGATTNPNYSDQTTISYLCAQCHGDFHDGIGTESPWLRHPTDIVLPSGSTEYAGYNVDNSYSVVAPVGSVTFVANGVAEAAITPGGPDSIVLCISCHRAHGTEYADLLRWDYDTMTAGQTTTPNTGCFICHTSK
ncbi:MAG: hypothetical protein JRI67_01120 [Deltaproteobacteria bacterium]|nr:hypothetical protein [Deltaproteobacteria bacterium]MBW1937360.1 hypothetical protein [Deltaproteobacteria bacterium]MBW1964212.1 hypothetical protein [Deltaproteobacteria bacterium]